LCHRVAVLCHEVPFLCQRHWGMCHTFRENLGKCYETVSLDHLFVSSHKELCQPTSVLCQPMWKLCHRSGKLCHTTFFYINYIMAFDNKTLLILGLIIGGVASLYTHQTELASAIFGGMVGYLSKDIITVEHKGEDSEDGSDSEGT